MHHDLGVTAKPAWHLARCIRKSWTDTDEQDRTVGLLVRQLGHARKHLGHARKHLGPFVAYAPPSPTSSSHFASFRNRSDPASLSNAE